MDWLKEKEYVMERKNQIQVTDRYEGDYKNGKKGGKGIFYYPNGDREMGDYYNGKRIGKHVILTRNGDVITKIFKFN